MSSSLSPIAYRSALAEPPARGISGERTHASERGPRLAFAGGGTGGHIVPGLHVVECVAELALERGARGPEPISDLLWFTSGRSVEERVLRHLAHGGLRVPFERVVLELEPEGGGAPSRSLLAMRTLPSIVAARRALERHGTDVLLGLGGYTSLPAVLAARSLSIPVALLEINARAGNATKWLARAATRVFHAWRSTVPPDADANDGESRRRRHVWTGPPLAAACFAPRDAHPEGSPAARAELGFAPDAALIVVLGGSQGSSALNRFVRAHAPSIVGRGVQILHQTGPGKLSEACAPFTGYRAVEYLDPVRVALGAATLIVCRGGASSLAEIAAARRPAVVVPYPHHADRHQEHNARALGAGVRIVDEAALGVGSANDIVELCAARAATTRLAMSRALGDAVPRDAGARIYRELCEVAFEKRRHAS